MPNKYSLFGWFLIDSCALTTCFPVVFIFSILKKTHIICLKLFCLLSEFCTFLLLTVGLFAVVIKISPSGTAQKRTISLLSLVFLKSTSLFHFREFILSHCCLWFVHYRSLGISVKLLCVLCVSGIERKENTIK